MENLVYLELLRCFDQVYTGEMGKWEVDFVALKNAKPHYFQVTMNLAEPAVIERETRSLLAIQDNFPKTIITYDKIHGDGIAGIEVVNLIDFLLEAY